MILKSRLKWSSEGTSRTIPVDKTLTKISKLVDKIGVTRLADITYMDRLFIPNYSSVLPGTDDYIWVYSGKGATKKHAKASALMESIERYSSLPNFYLGDFIQGSHKDLSSKYKILHPYQVVEPLNFDYNDEMIMDYLLGYDIQNKDEILVPAALALFRYHPNSPAINPFAVHHTNGLASGNVLEEAVCHSLCEVIERDAISLAQLRASAIPYHFLVHISENLAINGYSINGNSIKDSFFDDNAIFPDIDLDSIDFLPANKLIDKFQTENISLFIKDITSDIGIPTFIATSVEWISHDYGYLAEGHGTHPDKRIALLRSITEVSQTRAANIQGARDDLRKIRYSDGNNEDKRSWQFTPSTKIINFSDIPSYYQVDILDDINLILQNLKRSGLNQVIVVNLTNPNLDIPVVRTIVPGLETFKFLKSVIGPRAKAYFKK
ncbi:MAG: hypothetical protein DA328_01080 [Nitrososphaeraceae archaeon]|nr:hypothetical protein [Nitrososphaeraceae archaeon]